MISIKQLSYALAVEKTLHFKKAAEMSNISQSALSTALSELEKQLGIQIFERDNKRVLITTAGQQVLQKAHSIVQQIDELQRLAERPKAPLSFAMNIGVIPTVCPYLLPMILPTLNESFPRLRLHIVEEQSQQLVQMVKSGQIDTAVLALPFPCEGLLSLEFWQEDFYWVAPKSQALARKREITSRELSHSKLMLLKEGHCLKEHTLAACQHRAPSGGQDLGATSLNTLIQMVLGQLGTTIIPEMALDQLISQHQNLAAVHLSEPGPHRRIAFVVRPNYTQMSSIEALMQVCRSALDSQPIRVERCA